MAEQRIGVIGGSGLYQVEDLEQVDEVQVDTPFGAPSDSYRVGRIDGQEVVFLARHGRNHTLLPSELNFRANVYGFKSLGCTRLISFSAVGSMKEHIHPTHIVLPDQYIDRTKDRVSTFFGNGAVAHIAFSDPVCPQLQPSLAECSRECGATTWEGGTYVCMEGPAFSTRAESELYRSWGVDVIGMTNLPEAKLAREAEMCYSTVALVTDFDCWHETEEKVTVEMVLENLRKNAQMAQDILKALLGTLPQERTCGCGSALENALLTPADAIPPQTREKLDLLIGKYLD
jgi:5'-methylthioadenosine phosphorylase